MFKARELKVGKLVLIFLAVSTSGVAFLMFWISKQYRNSDYYYWSDAVRQGAAVFSVIGVFAVLVAAAFLGIGLGALYLEKYGKVCPNCEKVFNQSVVRCPKCGNDMIYAKNMKDFLADNPVALSNPLNVNFKTDQIIESGTDSGNPASSEKRFCTNCGNELEKNALFCPKCGGKK